MPGTFKQPNARSQSAKDRNNSPCSHCKKNRQRCDGGYPCTYCTRFNRAGCARPEHAPDYAEGFIQYDPSKQQRSNSQHYHNSHLTGTKPEAKTMNTNNSYGKSGGGSSSSHNQQSAPNNGSGNNAPYVSASTTTVPQRSQGFGHVQLIAPNGQPEGYIETFIHYSTNGIAYYGARYYDVNRSFIKEDLFLSRVGEGDSMQMLPPQQAEPYPFQDYGNSHAKHGSSSNQQRK